MGSSPRPMPRPEPSPLARALGRLPSGVYVVTARRGDQPVGFLGSFVQQVAFDPPTVILSVGNEREQLPDLRSCGRFALSVVAAASPGLMGPFLRRLPEGKSPFDGLEVLRTAAGMPVLAGALAWLDCRITAEQPAGDHVTLFGVVEEARMLAEGEPRVHLRRNGLNY